MSQEKNDNTYTAPNQAQKSQKEKTMDASRINSLATIDITQATTLEEQALIMQNNRENENSAFVYSDNIVNYYPGKYSQNNFATAEQKEEKKKEGYISSYVGDYDSNPAKNRNANLGNDVAFVQGHLNRLGILSDEHFIAEKPATEKEIDKSKIPHTIVAIEYFQREILSCKVDGEIWPGKGNIKSLVSLTVEQKDAKHLEYLKNKKEAEAKAAADKAKAEKEAEKERIKKELATEENLQKYYTELGNIEAFGKFLTDYVQYNPEFVLKAYDLMDFGESDNLTRAIMYNLKDSEIEKLPDSLDLKFYESLDAGWTVDEEYVLMDKLKTGKKPIEEKNKDKIETLNKESEKSTKFQKFLPVVLKHEGGYVNDPDDPGGATNKGITFKTFKAYADLLDVKPTLDNLKKLTDEQAGIIYEQIYWSKIKGDEIKDVQVAYQFVDFYINAGSNAIKVMQKSVNDLGQKIDVDGGMGPNTLKAINAVDAEKLFNKFKKNRIKYYENLAEKKSSLKKFLKGWKKRANSFNYEKKDK